MRPANLRLSDRAFALALTGLVAVLLAVGAARHEIWRDEAKAWVIARDSASPGELVANTEYEGHPLAWPLLLFTLTRLADDPIAMQAANAIPVSIRIRIRPAKPLLLWRVTLR